MKFVKMHGTGNDYIYVNLFEGCEDSVPATYDASGKLLTVDGTAVDELSIRISDRHFGIGSDGLICIAPSKVADARMIMFNADGSEGLMCGNGIRCVAKFAFDKGLVKTEASGSETGWQDDGRFFMTCETASGIKGLTLTIENDLCAYVEVNMGQAILKPADIPVDAAKMGAANDERVAQSGFAPDEVVIGRKLEVNGHTFPVTCVSMGNPHCVVFLADPEVEAFFGKGTGVMDLDLEKIGPFLESHEAFPEKINTEFVEIVDDHTIKMRVWERGSGETMSCGTGTCGATVASVLNGYVKRGAEVEVQIRGGSLYDTWLESGEVLMKGPATSVFTGEY